MPMNHLTTIYIVRHGQTEWNVKRLMQGHGDSPLTPDGIAQAKNRGNDLAHVHFDAVFSSDLLRANRTAKLILLEKQLAIKTAQALRERNYGKYEGKPYKEYEKDLKNLLEKYKHLSEDEIFQQFMGDVETREEAGARFVTFLREIAVGYKGKTVLIVSHGGVIRYFLIHLGLLDGKSITFGGINNLGYAVVESDGVDFFVKETVGIEIKKFI